MSFEVVSVVNFNNPARIPYLGRSFGSFYKFNKGVRHIVIDGSHVMGRQKKFYDEYGVELYHRPAMSFSGRLKLAMSLLQTDYWLCLPDDFAWIFSYPVEQAIAEARGSAIDEIKLTCRGMPWFSAESPQPQPWFEGSKVISGEVLQRQGNLLVSRRRWLRNFHEQFSLACNILRTDFSKWVIDKVPSHLPTGSAVEKWAYVILLPKRYFTAYYRMWIPAFHFIDLAVEGEDEVARLKSRTMLVEANFALYNRLYNQ